MEQRDLIIENIRKILELEELKSDVAKKIEQESNIYKQYELVFETNSDYSSCYVPFDKSRLLEIKEAKDNLSDLKKRKTVEKIKNKVCSYFPAIVFSLSGFFVGWSMGSLIFGVSTQLGLIITSVFAVLGSVGGNSLGIGLFRMIDTRKIHIWETAYDTAKMLNEVLTDEELEEKLKSIDIDLTYEHHEQELMKEEYNTNRTLRSLIEIQDIPLLQAEYSELEKLIASEKRELLLMGYPAYRDLETYLEEYEKEFAPETEYYPWVTSSVSNLKLILGTQRFPNTYKKR